MIHMNTFKDKLFKCTELVSYMYFQMEIGWREKHKKLKKKMLVKLKRHHISKIVTSGEKFELWQASVLPSKSKQNSY